jgi:hypothetical protein
LLCFVDLLLVAVVLRRWMMLLISVLLILEPLLPVPFDTTVDYFVLL